MFSKLFALFALIAAVSASDLLVDAIKTRTTVAGPSGTIIKEERGHLPLVEPELAIVQPTLRIHEAPFVLEKPTFVRPEVLPLQPIEPLRPVDVIPDEYEFQEFSLADSRIFYRSKLPHTLSYARAFPRFFY